MAIAFDAASSATGTGTVSHTCSGSNSILLVGYIGAQSGSSSVTYNGVSMTAAVGPVYTQSNFFPVYIYYLVAPAAGAHNIVVTHSGGVRRVGGISLTGVDQANPIDGSGSATGNSTSPSKAITTSSANSWIVDACGFEFGNGASMSSSQTARYAVYDNADSGKLGGSTKTTTTPGSVSMDWTISSAQWAIAVVGIKEAAASGPANLKTINGLAKASIKTVNGLAIASVKTVNGLA